MKHMRSNLWIVFGAWWVPVLAGCPYDGNAPAGGSAGHPALLAAAAGSGIGGAQASAIARAIAAAQRPLPPVPDEATLCKLRFTNEDKEHVGTSLDECKELFGGTDQETQSISEASLAYRFADDSREVLRGISLAFTWRSQDFWDAPPGYYLDTADVRGMSRPACWPHIDPTEN
jgi:hypothetical protein